ncbi:hypothetical protein AOLI_G00301460 [Acnodon oligacanthus]
MLRWGGRTAHRSSNVSDRFRPIEGKLLTSLMTQGRLATCRNENYYWKCSGKESSTRSIFKAPHICFETGQKADLISDF